jgi:hypothetical protein
MEQGICSKPEPCSRRQGGHYSKGLESGKMAFFPGVRQVDSVLTLGWAATYFPRPFLF